MHDQTVTRIEFALKLAHNGEIHPIKTATAERFLGQGQTRGRVGIIMRRESGPDHVGEWRTHDGGPDDIESIGGAR